MKDKGKWFKTDDIRTLIARVQDFFNIDLGYLVDKLLELERLAEIGRAFEKALKEEYGFINFTRYAGAVPEKWEMKESEYNDVLNWAKASSKSNTI